MVFKKQYRGITKIPGSDLQLLESDNFLPKMSNNENTKVFVDNKYCGNCCSIAKTTNAELYQMCCLCIMFGKLHRDNIIGQVFQMCYGLISCINYDNYNLNALINYLYGFILLCCAFAHGKRESSYFSYFCCLGCTANVWSGKIQGCGYSCCCCVGYDVGICCNTPCCKASDPKYCKLYGPCCMGCQYISE